MIDWLKRKLRRRIIHDEHICHQCGRDDLPLVWNIEKIGRITYEEGYICHGCLPEETPEKIEFEIQDFDGRPPVKSVEERKAEWLEFIKEVEKDAES